MRTSLLIAVLLMVLAGGAFLWLATTEPDVAPGAAPDAAPVAPPMPATPQQGSRDARSTAVPPPVDDSEPLPEAPAPPPPPTTTAPAATLVLTVHDTVTNAPAAAFRWQVQQGGDRQRGEGKDGRADLVVAASPGAELLVEAEGRQPIRRAEVIGAPAGSPPNTLALVLVPAVTAAGITLHVHDLALQPMAHVRVDAFAITEQNRDTAWHLEAPLWSRRNSVASGRYELPPLPAGEYGIRLVGLDEEGNLLPLLPYLHTFRLTGDNGFVEDVPLEPGCALQLDLVDSHGVPFDPTVYGTATLALRLPGGGPVQRRWIGKQDSNDVSAIDVLPTKGSCHVADPLPAGSYQLEVFVNGEPRVRQTLRLRASERQVERIVVP